MAEGCLADLTKQPCLWRNAKIRRKRLVGPAHVQAGQDVGIHIPAADRPDTSSRTA